jgi:hypothetical protein
VVVHSVLPDTLTAAVDELLRGASVAHTAHGDAAPLRAADAAAADASAVALIGPFRSADVAEAVEATAPTGLPLLAPVATWAGVTRDDEPGCVDPARHRGTVLRMVARDTEVAARIAADLRASRRRALVVAGSHDYGRQLDGQLRLHDLPRTAEAGDAGVVVLCGLAGAPELERAAALAPLPVVAFDGVQGADLGAGRDVRLALPFAPPEGAGDRGTDDVFTVEPARRAARLVAGAVRASAGPADRAALLEAMRAAGPFDAHGDLADPPVWLWRAGAGWALVADRPLPRGGAA